MPPESYRLTAADRAELCRRVDLLDVLRRDGVDVRRLGGGYVCALRPGERTPSCHVYPPGKGRRGADGWTLHDFGDGWGGDALAYLVDRRGLPFAAAVAELCQLAGWTPPGCRLDGRPTAGPTKPLPAPPRAAGPAVMPASLQAAAVAGFLEALEAEVTDAAAQGADYLAGRGVLPAGWPPLAYVMPAAAGPAVLDRLRRAPNLEALVTAGLIQPPEGDKPLRLSWGPWAGDVVLLVHHDRAGLPAALIARRRDHKAGDRLGKYLQQTYARGAARLPFGLPALYRPQGFAWTPAAAHAGDVLVVEGPLDALGAACLGWAALGLSMRPQAGGFDADDAACPRMLEPHLPRLRDAGRVLVVPDADPGEKGAVGEAQANRLVGWLRWAGVAEAAVAQLADLVAVPDGAKDLADVAAAAYEAAAERAAILEYDGELTRAEAERRAYGMGKWG